MENRTILGAIFLSVSLLIPQAAAAYEPQTTHAALTEETVRLFNAASPDIKIGSQEIREISRGSIDEDDGARALHHFFDPIHNTGLILTMEKASDFGLTALSFSSSKDWAKNSKDQAGADAILVGTILPYFSAGTDFSWPRAIYDYTWGDRARGLAALGHILHLIADTTVPDHTRNDPHPPFADAIFHQASPYEKWAGQFNKENIGDKGAININVLRPYNLASLDEYFINTASYSNNNFFSKDTIKDNTYEKPAIASEIKKTLTNGLIYNFGIDAKGMYLAVIAGTFDKHSGEIIKSYSLVDPDSLVLGDYWTRLSQKAVENGAGVISLFFREVEAEKQSRRLLELNRSWLAKAAKALIDFGKGLGDKISALTAAIGMFEDEPPEAAEVFNLPVSKIKPAAKPKEPPTKKTSAASNKTAKAELAESKIPTQETGVLKSKPPPPELSPPPLGRFIVGGGPPPPIEEIVGKGALAHATSSAATSSETILTGTEATSTAATTTAASATSTSTHATATSTPFFFEEVSPGDYDYDIIPPNVSLAVSECDSAATSTCFIIATSTAISWSSTSTDLDHFDVDCQDTGGECLGFPIISLATMTLEFTGTTSTIYTFSASATDHSGNRSPTTTKSFEFVAVSASTTESASAAESASTTESSTITDSASTTETSTATTAPPTDDPAPTDTTDAPPPSSAAEGVDISDDESGATDATDSLPPDSDSGEDIIDTVEPVVDDTAP